MTAPIGMDHLGSVNTFVQAAKTRSFTVAGRQMGISSSAVGKAVARLEERLGVRLFHRSTRSITLTPEGTIFLDRCRRILCEIEAAEHEMSQMNVAPQGKLRVSLQCFGLIVMPTVTAFMRAYPGIELDIDFSQRVVDVIDEGFDAVIHTCEVSDSRLMTRSLGAFTHRVVGSPDYFKKSRPPERPEDLETHACLHQKYASNGKLAPWPFRRPNSEAPLDLPVTTVSTTVEPLVCLAEQGFGVACLPLFLVRRQIEAGRLISVLENDIEDTGTIRIVWPSSRQPSPKVRAFVDFMADRLCADICKG